IVDLADEAPAGFSLPGRLQLQAGNQLTNALEGLAGSGGADVVLASFTLQAVGEEIPLLDLELLPRLSGIGSGELTEIDVVLDADADGVFDTGETSVTVGAVDYGENGVALKVVLAGQRLYADRSVSYLVVADISATINSTDQVRIDVLGVGVGPGVISEVDPVVSGGPVFGFTHVATGNVTMYSVNLENRQTGGSGTITLVFTTASALLAGDRIILDFPSGFDLSLAQIDTSSRTPAGLIPVEETSASSRRRFVLQLADVEDAGEYRLKLSTVINSAVAAADLTIAVSSEREGGTAVDDLDTDPFQFAIAAAVTSNVCKADFDGDGRVYFSDLFLFGDAFGSDGSSEFDLDGDGRVSFADFFVFSEVFADRCDSTDIGPDDSNALALEITVDLFSGTQMEFALIRAGAFSMGSPAEEEGRLKDEGPQREISLGESLYLGKFEVTQEQWTQVMGRSPWQGLPAVIDQGDHPAVYVSWNDVQAFVQTLNAAAGDSLYRLPSEAEWEYAARAGTSTRWSFGDDETILGDYAWTRRLPPVVSE
ncbi:MAG: SUMF1/EgtB/PvdO family nonheme iron enzyme, partial [Arenicellales bacterium]